MVELSSIQELSDLVVEQFDPDGVILFGSHARGDFDERSDVDLLVLLPQVDDIHKAGVAIRRALRSFPVPKDVIVIRSTDCERRSRPLRAFPVGS